MTIRNRCSCWQYVCALGFLFARAAAADLGSYEEPYQVPSDFQTCTPQQSFCDATNALAVQTKFDLLMSANALPFWYEFQNGYKQQFKKICGSENPICPTNGHFKAFGEHVPPGGDPPDVTSGQMTQGGTPTTHLVLFEKAVGAHTTVFYGCWLGTYAVLGSTTSSYMTFGVTSSTYVFAKSCNQAGECGPRVNTGYYANYAGQTGGGGGVPP